ncbi:extracellular calcium-sensing receptor-like [Chiloscyllium plagiosum]|uniref:extracellular calcium-sensing receptor-like n=1 Tax=Chiloscyllium plagiosum TaxID=36176 RepID=UPI001CB7B94E|nr:extracellular calcium-sensing receptor-like [Chiloscyllium plagiosum]
MASMFGKGNQSCTLQGRFNLPELSQDGDIIIGGVFPIHYRGELPKTSYQILPETPTCIDFNLRAFRWAQLMIFAIEEINNDPLLLPNITLGYKIYDSCATPVLALRAALTILNGQDENVTLLKCRGGSSVHALIADAGSTQSIAIARTVGIFGIPMVSYFSSCTCLSNKKQFPTFFRTVPSDYFQVTAFVQLVKHFGWTWLAVFGSNDDYGHLGISTFVEQVTKVGVCVAFSDFLPKVYDKEKILHQVKLIKSSNVKVILAFAPEIDLSFLMEELVRQNVTGLQWLASEGWSTAALLSTAGNSETLGGTLGWAIRRADIPGIKQFLVRLHPSKYPGNVYIKQFWEAVFHCTWTPYNNTGETRMGPSKQECTGQENLKDVRTIFTDESQLRVSYNAYRAVYAVAHSIHNIMLCKKGQGPFINKACPDISNLKPWQVLRYLKEVNFTTTLGDEVRFNANGDPLAVYDLLNWQVDSNGNIKYVKVGQYDASAETENQLVIQENAIIWNGGQKMVIKSQCSETCLPGTRKGVRPGQPICCFDCIPCAEGEISNETDSVDCLACQSDYWPNLNRDKCIPKEIEFLSFGDTMGIILTTLSLFGACISMVVMAVFYYYKDTPIVKANNSELSFLLLFALVFCFLCSLLFMGQPTVWSCMFRHTAFAIIFALCISCILGKTITVLMAFTATHPNNDVMKWFSPLQRSLAVFLLPSIQVVICILWLILSPPFPAKNIEYQSVTIILECDVGSATAFYCMLGYIGLLSVMCFVLAFLARTLPDNFNEAKFITFSMLIFCAVWITFIPVYINSGKYIVAVEIFAILSSSFSLLVCIFAPKVYIILLRPELNTKRNIMGRSSSNKF